MIQSNADNCPTLPKEGFHVQYRSGDFEHSISFGDTTCVDAIEYIAKFMLGCGFNSRVIAYGLKKSAQEIENKITA
jgi:hypothetical protein